MDIQRFKTQHEDILEGIDALRKLSRAGIPENAQAIAARLSALSSLITRHLAVEDRILYPAVQNGTHPALADMARAYQTEMTGIANAYIAFGRRWSTAAQLRADPEGFRQDANTVLKTVHQRLQKENREFYPAIEAA